MKKLFEAKQTNAGGRLVGPRRIYILATTEEAAEHRIRLALYDGILASAGCHCCGSRWEYVEEVDEPNYRGAHGENEPCYLDEEFNLLPVNPFTFYVDERFGAIFVMSTPNTEGLK
jgi:hypothetical protein